MIARKAARGRRAGGRNVRPALLVVCEGETEFLYFKYLKKRFRANWLEPKLSDVPDPSGIMACAEREKGLLEKKGLDVEAWVVFDSESEVEAERRRYRPVVESCLKKGLRVANSSPCFEYWPLIHFAPGVNVYEPKQAEAELAKPGRVEGYKKPNLPHDMLWEIYATGKPSDAARKRRESIVELGEDPRYGRPVTYIDELVDRAYEISRY